MNIYNLLLGEITQKELLDYYNANITYIELPDNIDGFIFQYKGINNIYVNKNLPSKTLKSTILHELAHIELNQFNQIDNDLFMFKIDKYEDEADRYVKFLLDCVNESN